MPPDRGGGVAVNLSLVGVKPTGLATYAINLIPQLPLPDMVLLSPPTFQERYQLQHPWCNVPANMSAEQGRMGHLRRLLWTQFQLPKLCARLQPNLIFSPVPEAPLGSKLRSVVVVHDLIPLRFPRSTSPLTQYFRHYVPAVLQQAQHIICNSTATASDIHDFFQIPVNKITPILLSHDANHFCVPEYDLDHVPDYVLDHSNPLTHADRPYFFYVGRHDPYKNLQRLINAFAALPHCRNYELWIAGSADRRYTPILHAQAAALGLTDQVKFLNYLPYDQLPFVLHQAIALVYPSLWEGFGFPVLEAMACGTPVITSHLSSLPEVAGDAAILVDPYSEAAITAAMQHVATDDSLRSQLSTAGLARASQFSWSKTGQATADLLRQYLS